MKDKARKLREQGLTYQAIAQRLGVGYATAYRWLNPDYAERSLAASRAWKARNREHAHAYDRAYNAAHKDECPLCGGEMERHSERCTACRSDEADRKAKTVVRLWAEGKSMREIQEVLGWSKGHLAAMMDRYRTQGYDLPYRYDRKRAWKYPHLRKASDRIGHNSA
jgi:transposase